VAAVATGAAAVTGYGFSDQVKTILHNLKYILIIRVLLYCGSYDSENTLGHVVYRAAMTFSKTLDLELHRMTEATGYNADDLYNYTN
jgi:hypothetical protein